MKLRDRIRTDVDQKTSLSRWIRILAVPVALTIILAACGDSGESSDGNDSGGASTTAAPSTTLQPQTGGTLTFAAYSNIAGLDPIVALGNGTSGAIQMAAVYDTLMRYDITSKTYKPQLAESIAGNADSTEWTLKLRPGVKFSDGTDYNAEAVRFGLQRHRSGASTAPSAPTATTCAEFIACPRNSTSTGVYMSLVKDVVAVDNLTVKITLNEPWASFPYALSAEPGMIPSPTAIKKCDGAKNPNTCDFNLKPVGAGPFTVTAFKTGESIEMARNPTYWNGPAYLDGIKFVAMGDLGGDKTYDALKTGTANGAYLRVPLTVATAKEEKVIGFSSIDQAGEIMLMNEGVTINCAAGKPEPVCTGKPDGATPTTPVTASLKVRQAIAAAYNPAVFNERVYSGKGLAETGLFQKSFPWDPGVAGPKYDLEAAKKLVGEAKAEGWNGTVRVLFTNSANDLNAAVALEGMLKAAGINATVDTSKDSTAQQAVVTSAKDFDLSRWGTSIGPDDSAIWAIAQNMASTSTSNRPGFKSAKVDQAVKDLRLAKTDDEKKAAYKVVAEEYNAQLPWINFTAVETLKAFSPKVHGVVPSHRNFVFFDKAWMEK
ncbi:MAG: ABC transporter substrate-binding protein [Acidimicrobiales bacterium]